jgi:RNA polymerase sigma-70 factor (ECF subfamily)
VTDEVLMLRFQRGDVNAFDELVQRHQTALFNFALRHVGNAEAAEDILQETLLRVVQRAADFKHEARFSTWVYTIARNLSVDHLRKMTLRQHSSFESPDLEHAPSTRDTAVNASPEGSVERAALAHELRDRITEAIERLHEEQREVFLLRELANLPFKEIAKITDKSENTVKSRMRYALERLQEALQAYEEDARALT